MRTSDKYWGVAVRVRSLLLASLLLLLPLVASAEFKQGAPTVLITGANRGIGLELARQYAAKGWNVIATSRHVAGDPALAALGEIAAKHPQVALEKVDVSDSTTVHAVAEKYRDQPIDVLINNAAAVEPTFAADMAAATTPFDKIDFDAARRDFDVNTLGAMRVAQAFLPNVEHSSQKKLVSVTSYAGSFGTPLPNGIAMNYSASKAALNKYMSLLAVQLKSQGIIVALVQPIFVASKSDLVGVKGAAPVDQEIGKLIKVIDAMTLEGSSGKITNFSTGKTDPF
jgi:NAD(P)-dependent dehydrogenase (short-subunit alcohol dehydrogenase family)